MENLQAIRTLMQQNTDVLEAIAFYVLAAIAIPFAVGVIFDRAIIRAGFLLIGVFGTIAGLFVLLQAQFLGMAQLMIYAVGITLVVVIALMLTNPRSEVETKAMQPHHQLLAFLTAFFLFVTIYMSLRTEYWPVAATAMPENNVAAIGKLLTTTYALPFEFASILLLAALMGAVMLAKTQSPGDDDLEYSEVIDESSAAGRRADSPEPSTAPR